MTANVTLYPLLCGFRDLVEGKHFLAEVHAIGRVLARKEEDGWWIDGVNPGGMSVGGETLNEAVAELRETFKKVMFDIAADVESFEGFKAGVELFFNESDAETVREWKEARDAVRAGRLTMTELPRAEMADSAYCVRVQQRRQDFDPRKNSIAEAPRVAA